MRALRLLVAFAVLSAISAVNTAAQEPIIPTGPFKTVHLTNLTDKEVTTLQAALVDMNAAVAKAGHPDIRYRLYKVAGKQAGKFSHLWEASWPSGEVYREVHGSTDWKALEKKYPFEAIMKDDVYNRYVEVVPEIR